MVKKQLVNRKNIIEIVDRLCRIQAEYKSRMVSFDLTITTDKTGQQFGIVHTTNYGCEEPLILCSECHKRINV
jgi:hypothetical protein